MIAATTPKQRKTTTPKQPKTTMAKPKTNPTLSKHVILHNTLARALSMKRPHGSEGTRRLTHWLEDRAVDLRNSKYAHIKVSYDAIGNLHVDARTEPHHRTLFVAHVDTVHRKEGPNKIDKTATHWRADGAPLGADDGAGCAMLMHLMYAGVPAYYVFTQGEECGGIGAKWLADNKTDTLLSQFDRAVAFDRRGIDSVITHQGYGRCCSDVFAQALADQLCMDERLMYLPDDTGVYTDTAEFTHVVPECTNISVGYAHEHSERESLDILHFVALAERVVQINWDMLPTDRDPSAPDPDDIFARYNDADDWYSAYYGGKATSVSASFPGLASSNHHLSDDDWLREDLRDAIYDAMAGSPSFLIEMICESVWPDDADLAARFINRSRLRDADFLKDFLAATNTSDPDSVMAAIFDAVYVER